MLIAIASILAVVVLLCMLRPMALHGAEGMGLPAGAASATAMRHRTLPPCVAPAVDGATSRLSPGFPRDLAAPGPVDPTSLRLPRPAKEWPRPPPTTPTCTYGADATVFCRPK